MIPQEAIRELLERYSTRYRVLGVFRNDVDLGRLQIQSTELSPGVLCFSLNPKKSPSVVNRGYAGTSLLEGYGFGLLSGAEADPNRVRVFRYTLGSWGVYSGPFMSCLKLALAPEVF